MGSDSMPPRLLRLLCHMGPWMPHVALLSLLPRSVGCRATASLHSSAGRTCSQPSQALQGQEASKPSAGTRTALSVRRPLSTCAHRGWRVQVVCGSRVLQGCAESLSTAPLAESFPASIKIPPRLLICFLCQ